ncbi:LacI family DNA-binding transcriptional regulator [Microbacterium sp. DT81.1]|uniref:LacI family DNA-binding transcriptional regulator n=1 Tax=Microbacterium sp. DT81.1 TaxID=3393413 RepID=UPI003CF7437C
MARHAGVSDAVVTYTLNGAAPVAAETARRVRESIRLLGYTPNATARALRMGSSRLIGVIVPDTTNVFIADLCLGVERAARARGYDVLTMNSDGDHDRIEEHVRALASRQVDGVLLALVVDERDASVLESTGMAWAVLNPIGAVPGARGVGVELADGAETATEHLLGHGYRRIGFLGATHDRRFDGWLATLTAAGLEPGPVVDCDFTRADAYRAGVELAARRDELEAVFISTDMTAAAALRAIHEHGVRVPDDLAIVSFDGSAEGEYAWPSLTTVRQPIDELAAQALDHLLDGPAGSGTATSLRGELIIRASCGC